MIVSKILLIIFISKIEIEKNVIIFDNISESSELTYYNMKKNVVLL